MYWLLRHGQRTVTEHMGLPNQNPFLGLWGLATWLSQLVFSYSKWIFPRTGKQQRLKGTSGGHLLQPPARGKLILSVSSSALRLLQQRRARGGFSEALKMVANN